MSAIELIQAVSEKAKETKKELTKSFFSGNKTYFNEMLSKHPNAIVNKDIYETINNIASMHARVCEY